MKLNSITMDLLITLNKLLKIVFPKKSSSKKNDVLNLFDRYISDKRYSNICYKVINNVHKTSNSLLTNIPKNDLMGYLTGVHASEIFYKELDVESRTAYLKQLPPLTSIKFRLGAGDSISEEEAVQLLGSVNTLTDIKLIKKSFPELNPVTLLPLLSSERIFTIGALNYYCHKFLELSENWIILGLDDKILRTGYRVTYYLEKNPHLYRTLKDDFNNLSYSAKSHFLAELNNEEISNLLSSEALHHYFKNPSAIESIININKAKYLSLLWYLVEKRSIETKEPIQSTLEEILNLYRRGTYAKEKYDSILDLEHSDKINLTIEQFAAENVAQFFGKLDNYDYSYTHKYAYRTLPFIVYRDDYDVNLALSSIGVDYDIRNVTPEFHKDDWVTNVEYPLLRIVRLAQGVKYHKISQANSLYKLLPYLIYSSVINSEENMFFKPVPLHDFIDYLPELEINKFVSSISKESYPLLSDESIKLVKERINSDYFSPGSMNRSRGTFIAPNHEGYPSGFTLSRKWIDVDYSAGSKFRKDYDHFNSTFLHNLTMTKNVTELEKLIIIYSEVPKDGKLTLAVSKYIREKYGYNGEQTYLIKLFRTLTVEETKTAVVLIRSWDGNEEDFLTMVKTL